MKFIKNRTPIRDRRAVEQLQAALAAQKATTDYIAMMADVEIPTEEGGEDNEQNVRED